MDTGQHNGTQRVTLKEAASRLGVTEGAIRKRVQRGSIHSEMGDDGRVYVYLDASQDASHVPLVEELRDRIQHLERRLDEEREARTEERRRHDTLMAQLMQRIPPQLEAPGGRVTDEDKPVRGDIPEEPQNASEPRSWWRRYFGL